MPNATVSKETKTFQLQSLEGGEVELRRLTYGEKLQKQDLITKMTLEADKNGSAGKMNMETMQRKSAEFEFSRCVVRHNLEDENGKPLNLMDARTFDLLDPQVGEEIASLISEMNDFERAEGNFLSANGSDS